MFNVICNSAANVVFFRDYYKPAKKIITYSIIHLSIFLSSALNEAPILISVRSWATKGIR